MNSRNGHKLEVGDEVINPHLKDSPKGVIKKLDVDNLHHNLTVEVDGKEQIWTALQVNKVIPKAKGEY